MGAGWDLRLDTWRLGWSDSIDGFRPHPADPDCVDHFWLPVRVPGDVVSAWVEHGLLEHPYFGYQDQKARALEQRVWWYRTTFRLEQQPAARERMWLEFGGIDTYGVVWLNGLELVTTQNQFVPLSLDVTDHVHPGENVVCVRLDPISLHVAGKRLHQWAGFAKERAWVRKAQMSWGWDWAPRLVTAGLWQPVWLRRRRSGRIQSLHLRTRQVTADGRWAVCVVEAEVDWWDPAPGRLRLELVDADGRVVWSGEQPATPERVACEVSVDHARLWWPHDLGEPYLYTLRGALMDASGDVVDRMERRVGIRTLQLRTERDGEAVFTFEVNGVPVFAKGANWIPVDCLYASAPDARYEQLVRLAKDAHMNMLRVWGGGIYERDLFYDLCDQHGILVWQDFMFACAQYPDYNEAFMASVRREVDAAIRRLRGHPCLALWCGNNENDWLYEMLVASGGADEPLYGRRIWHELIPQRLAELDPDTPYWPSSPYGGNDHNSAEAGDRHNWQVWHGHVYPRRFGEPERINHSVEGVSFKHYAEDTARFVSEFGMHASANRYTLARWLPEDALRWGHPALDYRNKDFHPEKGRLLMAGYTGEPRDFDTYLAYSMLTQAEGLRFGVEHYRRRRPATSGALIWQLNDSWPGTSWSIVDYHLLPKAAYYYARRFFRPVLWSLQVYQGQSVRLWGINDTRQPVRGRIRVEVRDWDGRCLFASDLDAVLDPCSAKPLAEWSEAELVAGADPRDVVLLVQPVDAPGPRQVSYLRDHREMRWPDCTLRWHVNTEAGTLTVETDRHARFIELAWGQPAIVCDDNFFDLPAGERVTLNVVSLTGDPVRWEALRVHALNARRDG